MRPLKGSFGIALLIAAVVTTGCKEERTGQLGQSAQSSQSRRSASFVIPAGTSFVASLESALSTATNHSGDAFHARTRDAIVVDGRTLVPAGAWVHGSLRDVQASGRVKGRAAMTLAFERIEDAQGASHAISAQSLTLQAESGTRGDVEKIAAGGVLGAIIGGIAGGGKGAVIGAGAGAGAGTILMLATKGDDVELEAGQKLNVYTTSPTSIVLAGLD